MCYLVDYNVQVGYEAAIQHSPIRIPYDDFVVKEDSRSGGYAITEMVTPNNQISLLDYGTVRTQSNSVWEKSVELLILLERKDQSAIIFISIIRMVIGLNLCIRMVNGIHMMMTIGRMSVNQVPSGRIMRQECNLYII